ncbi:hypothetical protein CEUSTIGMA_g2488.t1 [Chlamydomonas eustigma]|uniref:Uncharacterized protein n=1 Tax=Chlamydomonas eustigma TaxID=1157962 RepID=A0A250WW29_9CHLO|nr:hypothetical protein CEUSTIGMA_g2488.t1 [Chlamydomonas eustigma]|eukprot:GAX75044.1 hypothetical protein CEUSTIGMA_g2488.t1 [Chlamydomonas eustigma]
MSEENDFGEFEESHLTPVKVNVSFQKSTVNGTKDGKFSEEEEEDDDDEFGDFGGADEISDVSSPLKTNPTADVFSVPAVSAPVYTPAVPHARSEEPDILSLTDNELQDLISSSWRPLSSASNLSAESNSSMINPALSQLRAVGLMPHGVDPESILSYGGIPMTRVTATASTSSSAFSSGARTVQLLGSVYVPIAKCHVLQEWRGSQSEQRLLSSLGMLEIAQQAKEWEEAEAEAGLRYYKRGNLFGVGSMSGGGSVSGLSRATSSYLRANRSQGKNDGSVGSLSESPSEQQQQSPAG